MGGTRKDPEVPLGQELKAPGLRPCTGLRRPIAEPVWTPGGGDMPVTFRGQPGSVEGAPGEVQVRGR